MNRLSQALSLADEYSLLCSRGDLARASEARRTLADLVGRCTPAGVRFPGVVAEAMGRPDLAIKECVA